MMIALALLLGVSQAVPRGEEPVPPYVQSDDNAGARPLSGTAYAAFGGGAGVARMVDRFVDFNVADPRIGDIFKGQDIARIRRTLKEQFCYLLGGGCAYTGRDMKSAHKDLGLQTADFNAIVDNLQRAMSAEEVPFWAQNRLLARLAPMKRSMVER